MVTMVVILNMHSMHVLDHCSCIVSYFLLIILRRLSTLKCCIVAFLLLLFVFACLRCHICRVFTTGNVYQQTCSQETFNQYTLLATK